MAQVPAQLDPFGPGWSSRSSRWGELRPFEDPPLPELLAEAPDAERHQRRAMVRANESRFATLSRAPMGASGAARRKRFVPPPWEARRESQRCQFRLRLIQVEVHAHLAVHRRRLGKVLVGLVALAGAPVELAEA